MYQLSQQKHGLSWLLYLWNIYIQEQAGCVSFIYSVIKKKRYPFGVYKKNILNLNLKSQQETSMAISLYQFYALATCSILGYLRDFKCVNVDKNL